MNYRIEAITLPVSDVDRAKAFYEQAGWHLDVDTEPAPGMRVVQLTPPGSDCSITFGIGMGEQSEPGSYRATYLVVSDIEPAHRELKERGIPVTDIFHYGPEGQGPVPIRSTATTTPTRPSRIPTGTRGSSRRFPAEPAPSCDSQAGC